MTDPAPGPGRDGHLDTWSTQSRAHHGETGRWLARGAVDPLDQDVVEALYAQLVDAVQQIRQHYLPGGGIAQRFVGRLDAALGGRPQPDGPVRSWRTGEGRR